RGAAPQKKKPPVSRRLVFVGRRSGPHDQWKNSAIIVAPMNVPALAARDTTTIFQPSLRNAGRSFRIDRPAMARMTVVNGRKFTLPTAAMIWSEYGSTPGQPAVMAISD